MKRTVSRLSKYVTSVVLSFLFLFVTASAETTTSWVDAGNYSAPTQFDASSKTITITTAQELAWISYSVMNGTTFKDYTILLANDIDLSMHLWQPIGGWNGTSGDTYKVFSGTFDGQGHVIKNMHVLRPGLNYNGLFGCVEAATIKNVELIDYTVNCQVEGNSWGSGGYSAGLVGYLLGYSNADNNTIINCGVSGDILAGRYSGGLIGYSPHTSAFIYNSYSNSTVSNDYYNSEVDAYALGSSGFFYGCWYNADKCVFAVESESLAKNCFGITQDSLTTVDYVTLLNKNLYVGAVDWIEGEDRYPTFGRTYSRSWDTYAEPVEEQDNVYYVSTAEELAYLAKVVNSGNSLQGKTVKLMDDINLSGKCWTPIGATSSFAADMDGNGKTITGLTITDNNVWKYIGLVGNSTGNIYSLTLNDPKLLGSFPAAHRVGILASTAGDVISNCHVVDCSVEVSSGLSGVGGLVGYGPRLLTDCSVTGAISSASSVGGVALIVGSSVSRCFFSGTIDSGWCAGGIACSNNWGATVSVEECYSAGTITAAQSAGGIMAGGETTADGANIKNCYSFCDVTGEQAYAGGIVGSIGSWGNNCRFENCYSVGNISAGTSAGMVLGGVYNSAKHTISNCYWNMDATMAQIGLPAAPVGMAGNEDLTVALSQTDMKNADSYVGFDFDTIWGIDLDKNGGLPYLLWQTNVPVAIAPSAIRLSESVLTMNEDSSRWLSVIYSPANAGGEITWFSSDLAVAMVTTAGQVVAVAPGTATITATCGTLTASCVVTVNERPENSYILDGIQLESDNGQSLSAIPQSSFWVNVPFTKNAESDDAVVVVTAYTSAGQYIGMYAMRTTAPVGYEQVFSILLDNTNGKIGEIRAYVWSSLAVPVPLTASVSTNN